MHRVSAVVLLMAVVALAPFAAAAQEATPPPGAEAPRPEECRAPLLSTETFMSVLTTPAAEPGAATTDVPGPGEQRTAVSEDEFPTGEPADAATAEAVEAAVREYIACANARDFFRLLSIVSHDTLRELAGESGPPSEAEVATAAAMPPSPLPEAEHQLILDIRDARVFPDGRVGVVLVEDVLTDEEGPQPSLIILVQSADRWLIDAAINVQPEDAEP